ncbi:MAG: T9SS type A sorting domain-containing protein [Bacteroidota bacterium]
MKSFITKQYLLLITLLSLCFTVAHTQNECAEDMTAPVAICNDQLQITVVDGVGRTLWPFMLDDGSYDECSSVDFFLTFLEDDTGSTPSTTSLLIPDLLETYQVVLYVVDEAGNENSCITNVMVSSILANPCPDDEEAPTPICINGLSASLDPTATIWADDIMASPPVDNCPATVTTSINLSSESTGAPQGAPSITFTEAGLYEVEVWVIDFSGNSDFCLTYVIIEDPSGCEDDDDAPQAICTGSLVLVATEDYGAPLSASTINAGSYDNCSSVSLFITNLEDDDGSIPTTTDILLPPEVGTYQVVLYVVDESGNHSMCWVEATITDVIVGPCTDDTEAPQLTCRESVLGLFGINENSVTVFASNFVAEVTDNCDFSPTLSINLLSESTGAPQGSASYTTALGGIHVMEIWAEDDAGNTSVCTSILEVRNPTNCSGDEIRPTVICEASITASAIPDFGLVIWAQDLDEGSTDNCSDVQLFVTTSEDDTGEPPSTTSVQLPPELGTYTLVLYAVDQAGNFNSCFTDVTITDLENDGCLTDDEAPNILCLTGLSATLDPLTLSVTVDASTFVFSATDNCDDSPTVSVNLVENSTGAPQGDDQITFISHSQEYAVEVWAIDDFGNSNFCVTNITIEVEGDSCFPDDNIPIAYCVEGLTVTADATEGIDIWAEDIDAGSFDWCSIQVESRIILQEDSDLTYPITPFITLPPVTGTYPVELWVADPAGNLNMCTTTVTVEGTLNCDDDTTAPVAICDEIVSASTFTTQQIELTAEAIDDGSYDDCSSVDLRIILAEDSDGTLPSTSSIIVPSVMGESTAELWVVDQAGNTNVCNTTVIVNNILHPLAGQVYLDANDNCLLDAAEENSGFAGWFVRATDVETGISETVATNEEGLYFLYLNLPNDNPRDIEVELILPEGLSTGCATTILLEDYLNFSESANFALGLAEDCNYLSVDVAAPFLRRCFENEISVAYTNYSGIDIEDVVVQVNLDPLLAIQSASQPYVALGNGEYLFDIGTLTSASSGSLVITAILSCESELGQTHCITASIEPFTCSTDDEFAEIIVSGECDEEEGEVRFTVRNAGTINMTQAQQIRIVEDVIMYMNGPPVQLDAGSEEEFSYPANGSTWRLEIPQDDSYPYGGTAAAFVEGCGGFTPGMATQFSLSTPNPNEDQLCLENIGAYDPNDKQALPKGYGEAHYIEANTPLEYLIRFQNTGTDTAFNIRIEDQISEHLDPTTIVPGTSSHPYRMELKEDGLLIFHFDNIMLPDSNVNLAGSNGFVQFSIEQLLDNPINTIIENTAGIYFDFNDPIITNTVWHTIGEDFIMVQSHEVLRPDLQLTIAPNPVQTRTHIRLEGETIPAGLCQIYDAQGRLLQQIPMQHNELWIERSQLPHDGLFLFRISSEGVVLAQGKLIAQ